MSSSERADAMDDAYNQLPGALRAPTLADVFAARRQIRPHLERTPLRHYASLDRLVSAEVWVKHDNLLPTAAIQRAAHIGDEPAYLPMPMTSR